VEQRQPATSERRRPRSVLSLPRRRLGQIACIDIELLPIGLAFHPGEQLRFIISARNLLGTLMPGIREYVGANTGQHVIHTGGEHASYLQLPISTPR